MKKNQSLNLDRGFVDPFASRFADTDFFPEPSELDEASDPTDPVKDDARVAAEFDRFLADPDKVIRTCISDFAERLLSINREDFTFEGRKYLKPIYNISEKYPEGSRNIILVSGRQVEKSTTLAGKSLVLGSLMPAFFTLFVQPRYEQVKVFSQQRFQPMAEDSAALQKMWLSNKNLWQVGARELNNRSYFNFRSCYYSADASRGITAHNLCIDELQDIISDNIPILEECQSHFGEEPEKRFRLYSGTPKTTNNTLSVQHKESSQFEWLVKCHACNNHNFLDDKVVGKHFYICNRCGKQIYPRIHGQWVAMRPSKMDTRWGFRIPQIMVPFMSHSDVLKKMEDTNIPRRVFFNEVLGLAFDEGELVLTEADVFAACENRPSDTPETIKRWNIPIVAGVDHGTGGYSSVDMHTGAAKQNRRNVRSSFTVVAFGGFCGDGRFRVFKIIKFVGEMTNLAQQPELIDKIIREHGAGWVMSDWGFGAHTNASLVSNYGWKRLDDGYNPLMMEVQYVRAKVPAAFHPKAFRYMVDRNYAIELTTDAIKRQQLLFFNPLEMEGYVDDFTSLFVEYDFNLNRMRYDHVVPDDCFQAVVYAFLAARQQKGLLVPTLVPNI